MSYSLTVSQDDDGRRLDRVLRSAFKAITLGQIMKAIRQGNIRVNSSRARDGALRVSSGDILTVPWVKGEVSPPKYSGLGNISIIFQGDNVMVVSKPPNLLVQPDVQGGDSVISRIRGYLGSDIPAAVHRLDRNTTGVLAIALHGEALRSLTALFKARKVRKIYMAVVAGIISENIPVDAPLLKDADNNTVKVSADGLNASTRISPVASDGEYTLVRIELLTGRTHQARVHTAYIGHPIIGDRKYGDFSANRKADAPRPLLHAYELSFPDDTLSEIAGKTFTAQIPPDMKNFLDARGLSL